MAVPSSSDGTSPSGRGESSRLYYLDNLKLFLTALVVVHHVAITYGGEGSWFYQEKAGSMALWGALTVFTVTNQFFFMGLFFFVSGFFTPSTFDRKGSWNFVRDRLLRLGVPLLVFTLLVSPYLESVKGNTGKGYLHELMWRVPRGELSPGPLWFVEVLLVFSLAYALARKLLPGRPAHPPQGPMRESWLWLLATSLAAATFLVRLAFRAGDEVLHLQLAFFPQYIALYTLGIVAARRGWLESMPSSLLRTWVPVLGACLVALVALMSVIGKGADHVRGGLHVAAAVFALLENMYCVGACAFFLVLFRDRFPNQSPFTRVLAGDAFAAYIVHAPVIVALAVAMREMALAPVAKLAVLSTIGLAGSFAVAHALRALPGMKRFV